MLAMASIHVCARDAGMASRTTVDAGLRQHDSLQGGAAVANPHPRPLPEVGREMQETNPSQKWEGIQEVIFPKRTSNSVIRPSSSSTAWSTS